MSDPKPILSICVPTYNKATFLRVMLQALLPQVAECDGRVEVWVLDNASTDATQAVIDEARELGPFQTVLNQTNLGAVNNIVKGPLHYATGEHTWILGHHNLLMPDGLKTVLDVLSQDDVPDVLYVNFRCARYPDHWPDSAEKGHDGEFAYLGNKETEDRSVPQWQQLIRPENTMCTQMYAHIVKTQIWRSYWTGKEIGPDFRNALTCYPHTRMLVDEVFNEPSYYVGNPVITIFNGAQAWGNPETKCDVYLRGLPELFHNLSRQGMPPEILRHCKQRFALPETTKLLTRAMPQLGLLRLVWVAARNCPSSMYVWKSISTAFVDSECNALSRLMKRTQRSLKNRRNWWIVNCRPARWIKAFGK